MQFLANLDRLRFQILELNLNLKQAKKNKYKNVKFNQI